MTVKVSYSPLMKKKAQRLIDRAIEERPVDMGPGRTTRHIDRNKKEREDEFRAKWGVSLGYLEAVIRGTYTEPSGRVLKNLGFEVLVRDVETGETEVVDFAGRCEVDWSDPKNPRSLSVEE